jgi:aspartyl protease family protein
MKSTVLWTAFWVAVLGAGFFVSQHLLAPPPVVRTSGGGLPEIAIPAARDGHFYLDGAVNGVPIRFMVDTGATYVSIDAAFARRAGLPEGVRGYFNTANGSVEGRLVRDQVVQAQGFEVGGLTVAVMPAASTEGLLGQNFLRQFEVSQSSGTLKLRAVPPR